MNKKIKALLLAGVLSISMVGCDTNKTNEINQESIQDKQIEEIKHLVGIRAKDVFDYGKIIKEHLGISKVNKDYNIIKEMFFYEVGVSKWEDLNYSRECEIIN